MSALRNEILEKATRLKLVHPLTKEHGRMVSSWLAEVQQQEQVTPLDERLPSLKGHLQLLLGNFEEAEAALRYSLQLPWCRGNIRAVTYYNLACAYALTQQVDACYEALLESSLIEPLPKEHTYEDPDLSSVKHLPWFAKLLERPDADE